jgi:hypothetical protein
MKRIVAIACFAAAAVGCASSAEIQSGAYDHLHQARVAEAHGDYYTASREHAAANKQFAKAQRRAYEEAYYGYW